MGRCLGLVVVLAGCGRVNFDPLAGDGGPSDDGAGAVTCWPAWKAGTPSIGAPRQLTELGAGIRRGDPSPMRDALTLYYYEDATTAELHYATRTDRSATWTPRGLIPELASTDNNTKLTVTADGLTGVFASTRVGNASYALWMTTRTAASGSFGAPTQSQLAPVNIAGDNLDPHIASDGLHLYFAPDPGTGQQIVVASRATSADVFATDRVMTELAMPDTYSDPTVSPDELVIAYAAQLNAQLFYAVRTDRTQPFGAPQLVPNVNGGAGRQTDVELTHDGCEIYFSSTRSGTKDVYVSVVTP